MATAARKNVIKVVVVEDEPSFLSFWERILKSMNVKNVHFFSNPKEAAEYLKESPVDLLISDIVMPSIDGYKLAKLARKVAPDCRVILTTAYSTDLSRFDLAGFRFHLLHKPYTDIVALKRFVAHLMADDQSFDDISEDSASENEDYPQVIEWKL